MLPEDACAVRVLSTASSTRDARRAPRSRRASRRRRSGARSWPRSAPRATRCARSRWWSRPSASSTDCSPVSARRTCRRLPTRPASILPTCRRLPERPSSSTSSECAPAAPSTVRVGSPRSAARPRRPSSRRCSSRRTPNRVKPAVASLTNAHAVRSSAVRGLRQLARFGRQGHRVPPMSRVRDAASRARAGSRCGRVAHRRRPALPARRVPAPTTTPRRSCSQGPHRGHHATTSSASCRSSGGRRRVRMSPTFP